MCVQMKFQVCADLAKSSKVSIQDLLRHASHKVYGCITQLMMMNADVINIIDSYITLDFFSNELIHKSWYYLLVNDLISRNILEESILSLTTDVNNSSTPIYTLDRLKKCLHELISRIALTKKFPD